MNELLTPPPHQLDLLGRLQELTTRLAKRAKVPPPRLQFTDHPAVEVWVERDGTSANIYLSYTFVAELSLQEAEGIIAHEIAHIQLGHHRLPHWLYDRIGKVWAGAGLLVACGSLLLLGMVYTLLFTSFLIGGGYSLYWGLRRWEYQADCQGSLLLDNPQQMIRTLHLLLRYEAPVPWYRQGVVTHPSPRRRLRRLRHFLQQTSPRRGLAPI